MKNYILIGLIVILHISVSSQEVWKELFNGKDLTNWEVLNGTAEYYVKDGAIVGVSQLGTRNTFLAYKKMFDDFILVYEAKIDSSLNSGVQIRSLSKKEYRDGVVHGYQVEIDTSPRAWTGGLYDEARRGWLYHLEYNKKSKSAFRLNEWNHFRIEAIGKSIRVWVNETPTVDLMDDMTSKGFIALQVHSIKNHPENEGKTVRFRNIRILTKNLKKSISPNKNEIPQVSYLTNQLTDREKAEGWQMLWDGKTTNGWRGAKLNHFPKKSWKIEHGLLKVLKGTGAESVLGGDIVTIKKYRNFVLEVDFKFTKGANSGIKYFVDTELNKGEGSSIGCEFQILDDRLHPDAKKGTAGNRTLASLYDIIPANAHFYVPNESKIKQVNEYGWNRARIVAHGNHVEHYLNGIKVVAYERRTQIWRALVARSKYVVWPNFGEAEEGHILLQEHGDEVHFKNIKIKIEGES